MLKDSNFADNNRLPSFQQQNQLSVLRFEILLDIYPPSFLPLNFLWQ